MYRSNRLHVCGAVRTASVFVLAFFGAAGLYAQQTSGSIEGRVVDPQGAAIVGAKVTLNDQRQGGARGAVTTSEGTFAFTPVVASVYTIVVEAPGFSKLDQKDIRVYAADKLSLPKSFSPSAQ